MNESEREVGMCTGRYKHGQVHTRTNEGVSGDVREETNGVCRWCTHTETMVSQTLCVHPLTMNANRATARAISDNNDVNANQHGTSALVQTGTDKCEQRIQGPISMIEHSGVTQASRREGETAVKT